MILVTALCCCADILNAFATSANSPQSLSDANILAKVILIFLSFYSCCCGARHIHAVLL